MAVIPISILPQETRIFFFPIACEIFFRTRTFIHITAKSKLLHDMQCKLQYKIAYYLNWTVLIMVSSGE